MHQSRNRSLTLTSTREVAEVLRVLRDVERLPTEEGVCGQEGDLHLAHGRRLRRIVNLPNARVLRLERRVEGFDLRSQSDKVLAPLHDAVGSGLHDLAAGVHQAVEPRNASDQVGAEDERALLDDHPEDAIHSLERTERRLDCGSEAARGDCGVALDAREQAHSLSGLADLRVDFEVSRLSTGLGVHRDSGRGAVTVEERVLRGAPANRSDTLTKRVDGSGAASKRHPEALSPAADFDRATSVFVQRTISLVDRLRGLARAFDDLLRPGRDRLRPLLRLAGVDGDRDLCKGRHGLLFLLRLLLLEAHAIRGTDQAREVPALIGVVHAVELAPRRDRLERDPLRHRSGRRRDELTRVVEFLERGEDRPQVREQLRLLVERIDLDAAPLPLAQRLLELADRTTPPEPARQFPSASFCA